MFFFVCINPYNPPQTFLPFTFPWTTTSRHCAGYRNGAHSAGTLVLAFWIRCTGHWRSIIMNFWHQTQCCNNNNWMFFFVFLDVYNCQTFLPVTFVNSSWLHVCGMRNYLFVVLREYFNTALMVMDVSLSITSDGEIHHHYGFGGAHL